MDTSPQPDSQEVAAVETSLFNRMVKNAFFGFIKSAVIGAIIGLAVGGLFAGVHATMIGSVASNLGETILSGALQGAAWLGGAAGSFGAVAGIQSTRDTRRWFLMHEDPELSPEQTREQAVAIQPELTQKSHSCGHFQKMVGEKPQARSESPRVG